MVVRMIHTCGQVDLTEHVAFTPDVVSTTHAALAAGAPILCDSSMVAAGITAARLPAGNQVVSLVADPRAPELRRAAGYHPLGSRCRPVGRPARRCGAGHRQRPDGAVPAARLIDDGAPARCPCSAGRWDSSARRSPNSSSSTIRGVWTIWSCSAVAAAARWPPPRSDAIASEPSEACRMSGTLFGVGLGPGDPELVTVKAAG